MATLLQRPPLAMFDPSLIHRNDEIFNPEPNGLGFFLRCRNNALRAPWGSKSQIPHCRSALHSLRSE